MKRILALAMCLALMMTSFVFVSAETEATLTVATVDGPFAAGDEIAIPVTITEWANAYAVIELAFDYDETILTLDAIEASEDDFSGSMSASNGNLFSLICNPSSDRQANKLLDGEVCVLYFIAKFEISASTAVNVTAAVKGYAQGKGDNWTATQELNVEVENGGVCVEVGPKPLECIHEGGVATCCAKAVCDLCGEEYGEFDAANHAGETEIRDASETYTGDTYCLGCNTKIADGEAIEEEPNLPDNSQPIDATVTMIVETVNGPFKAGDEIAVSVGITDWAKGYAAIELTIAFDETVLQLDAIEPSENEFKGSMGVSHGKKFALICNTENEKQAQNTDGGEICVIYFIAATDINESVAVEVETVAANGYVNGIEDNWTQYGSLTVEIENGGIKVDASEPVECTHEGGTATCNAKAVCTLCGEEYGELDATNHAGGTEVRGKTETYTGDTWCLGCNTKISDGRVIDPNNPEYILGDVNGDGKINAMDAMLVSQYYVELPVDINLDAADVSGDGKINAMDAMLISQYYVELIDKFPADAK